eukprot:scaffold117776_cov44-Attheya_sp.AAC.2
MLRRTWQAFFGLETWSVRFNHWKSRYQRHGRLSLDIDQDVEHMAGCEWLRDMVGSYIRNQDVEGMGN